jgi:hypothetical protein
VSAWAEAWLAVAPPSRFSAVGALRRRGSPPTHAPRKEEVAGALDLRRSLEIGGARRRRGRGASAEEVELPPLSSRAPWLPVYRRHGSRRSRRPGSAPPVDAEGGSGAGRHPPSGRRLAGLPPLLPPRPEEVEMEPRRQASSPVWVRAREGGRGGGRQR